MADRGDPDLDAFMRAIGGPARLKASLDRARRRTRPARCGKIFRYPRTGRTRGLAGCAAGSSWPSDPFCYDDLLSPITLAGLRRWRAGELSLTYRPGSLEESTDERTTEGT